MRTDPIHWQLPQAQLHVALQDREQPSDNALVNEEIRQVIQAHARLTSDIATLSDDADLYQAGMTSHASVNLMLALEDRFDLEFPDRMLRRTVFESVSAIAAALEELQGSQAVV
jgi:acyl carrier protein